MNVYVLDCQAQHPKYQMYQKFEKFEKVKQSAKLYRKEREKYLINKFDTFYNELNKNIGG